MAKINPKAAGRKAAKVAEETMKYSNASVKKTMDAAKSIGKDVDKVLNKASFGGVYQASKELITNPTAGVGNALNKTFKNKVGDTYKGLNYGKIAATTVGTAAAGRIISGGGLYKDKNGNTNLIGIPFV